MPSNTNTSVSQEITIISQEINGDRDVVDTFTTLEAFTQALADNCADAMVTSEDFAGGPAAITTCGDIVSSAGDGCFPSGEIEEGFSSTSSDIASAAAVVNIPPGAIGNIDSLIGASSFAEFTIINFDEGVYAAAFDIWENIDPSTEIRFFDLAGDLMETITVDAPINAQTFFGFYGNELVGSIEIEGAADSGELFGNLVFGADCSNLSVQEQNLAAITVFPNPAKDFISVTTPSAVVVKSLTLIDLGGKKVLSIQDSNTLDLSQIGSGLYLLQVETIDGTVTRKIAKQ